MAALANLVRVFCFWSLVLLYGVLSCFYLVGLSLSRKLFSKDQSANYFKDDHQPKALTDAALGKHRFTKLQGVKLHYVEEGNPENPLVVLIHGSPGFWFCWRKQIPLLANHFRVVAPDLRGCGDSEIPKQRSAYKTRVIVQDIALLIKSLNHPSAHIVCNETAGNIGWQLATSYPHLVGKMVFINAPHPFVIRQLFQNSIYYYLKYWYLLFLQVPILPELLILERTNSILDLGIGSALNRNAITNDEVDAYKYTFSRQEDWYGVIHHLRQIDLFPFVEINQPPVLSPSTLLLMGSNHPYLSKETAYRSAEFVERIKIKVVEGGQNSLQVTHFRKINDEILNFLEPPLCRPPNFSPSQSSAAPSRHSLVDRVIGAVKSPYTMLTRKEGENYTIL